MIILGIETSCDETAVALVRDDKTILAHTLYSQLEDHQVFGGVVPEIAARRHLEHLQALIQQTFRKANLSPEKIDGVAATCGPGLIGGLIVGVMVAKSIAAVHHKPFLAINHLIGHALTPRLTANLEFPYLLLLLSGGHCQLVIVKSAFDFKVLGTTQDDAVGECLDKCAKMLGLAYPGGVAIEKAARQGNPYRFSLPRPLKGHREEGQDYNFSFSGLKSAVRREIEKLGEPSEQDKKDLCASLQQAISDVLQNRLQNALLFAQKAMFPLTAVVVAGGVAANQFLRQNLEKTAALFSLPFIAPPVALCTDNGAMIAWAGIEKLRGSQVDTLEFKPRPRWPLEIRE